MPESVVDDVTNRLLDKLIHLMISRHFLWTFVDNRDINCLVKTFFSSAVRDNHASAAEGVNALAGRLVLRKKPSPPNAKELPRS